MAECNREWVSVYHWGSPQTLWILAGFEPGLPVWHNLLPNVTVEETAWYQGPEASNGTKPSNTWDSAVRVVSLCRKTGIACPNECPGHYP